METDKKTTTQRDINLRRINLVFLLFLIILTFYLYAYTRKQAINEKQHTELVARMQEQAISLTEANAHITFEMEQLSKAYSLGDTILPSEVILQRKLDSIERLNYYNSVMNRIVALNNSTLSKAQEDNQKLYDNYLTHINTIIAFFSIIIAVISIFVPYLINKKTDDIIKQHDEKLNNLTDKIKEKANEAKRSAIQSQINTINSIATMHEAKGEYTNAIEKYKNALTICRSNLGENHPDTALIYYNMAKVYVCMGDFASAKSCYTNALLIREAILGKDHLDTAEIYDSMGELYENLSDYKQALDFYNKALLIKMAKLSENHLDTTKTFSNIAWVYEHMGEYDHALEYHMKALKAWLNRNVQDQSTKISFKTSFRTLRVCYEKTGKQSQLDDWMKGQLNKQEWEAYTILLDSIK